MKQTSLFESARLTYQDAMASTAKSINAVAKSYNHWQISFSGGKDSTTLVTVVLDLIDKELIPRPKSLTVMYADTRLELPPLHASAMQVLEQVKSRGFGTQAVMAELDKRFMVYLLGRGVPPPNNSTLRWCTQQIKLNPMKAAMERLYQQHGERILSFNGVRLGESAMRDRRIALSCSKNGSECGQGWFQRDLPDAFCDKLSPILHWRVCHIWDWLMMDAPALGFDTALLAEVYGGDEAQEINARTGCVGCPLASRDVALENLVRAPNWEYLKPLLGLRSLWDYARSFNNRLQKVGEKNQDGNYSSNPNRKGPLTLAARSHLLTKVLDIQLQVNLAALKLGNPVIDLINEEEQGRIEELIAAKTFPNKWTGDELIGSALAPQYDRYGNIQHLIPGVLL